MRENPTTTDFADFGHNERVDLMHILIAWNEQGLPKEFYEEEVRPMFNRNSGMLFLTNSEYQVAAMNEKKLEIWNSCPNCGHEGFAEDCRMVGEGCNECKCEVGYEREEEVQA